MWSVVVTIENLFFTALADEFNVKSADCFFFTFDTRLRCSFKKSSQTLDFGIHSLRTEKSWYKAMVNLRTKLAEFPSLNLLV